MPAGWRPDRLARGDRALGTPPDDLAERRHGFLTCIGDIAGLAALLEQASADSDIAKDRDFQLGVAYTALGKPDRARPHLATVAANATRLRDDAWAQIHGAVALELLGQRAAAIAAADEAARLSAQSYDAVNGPLIAVERAWVLIHSGSRAPEGYAELERWLGGYALQPGDVAKEPLWLILRDDARVQQIFAAAMKKQALIGSARRAVTLPAPAGDHPR